MYPAPPTCVTTSCTTSSGCFSDFDKYKKRLGHHDPVSHIRLFLPTCDRNPYNYHFFFSTV